MADPAQTTWLLRHAREGHREAADELFEHLYDELRELAQARLSGQRPGATLDTTMGLVHEAYLRLVDRSRVIATDRAHFFALAARAMRFILLDRTRARVRQKRGGSRRHVTLDAVQVAADESAVDLLALDEALTGLRAHSEVIEACERR